MRDRLISADMEGITVSRAYSSCGSCSEKLQYRSEIDSSVGETLDRNKKKSRFEGPEIDVRFRTRRRCWEDEMKRLSWMPVMSMGQCRQLRESYFMSDCN